jgi:UPF0716 protein FxsA
MRWRWWLLLLFTVVPAVELFLLLRIGALVGPTPTVVWLLLAGLFGAWLAKREGLHLIGELSVEMRQGLPPAGRLVEGGMVVAGAVLLVTPGVLTDLVGLLLILPPTRRWLAPRVLKQIAARFEVPSTLGPEPDDPVRIRRPKPAAAAEPAARKVHPFASPFDDLP